MKSFATGFVTGFADSLKQGVDQRAEIARDYFQKQYELASTVGVENYRRVESAVDTSVKTAKQLQQMGVPRNIIMAVASQDPLSLGDFYKEVAEAQANGVVLDQAFFDDFVEVSKDFQAPNEDFSTFFRKALSPISRVASQNPEGFNRDRKGGILGALFGANPIGRAQRKLDETVVIEGLSASDLGQYGKDYSPAGVSGAPTVTYNYSAGRKPKAADEFGGADRDRLNKAFEDLWPQIRNRDSVSDEEAKRRAVDELMPLWGDLQEGAGGEYLRRLVPTAGAQGGLPVDGEITQQELPEQVADDSLTALGITAAPREPTAPPTEASPPAELPSSGAPATPPVAPAPEASPTEFKPIIPEQEGLFTIRIKGKALHWRSNNPDKTVTYVDDEGTEYIMDPNEVREFVKTYGNDYKG